MKKKNLLRMAACMFVAATMVACSSEDDALTAPVETPASQMQGKTLHVTGYLGRKDSEAARQMTKANPTSTRRVAIAENGTTSWEDGDKIAVCYMGADGNYTRVDATIDELKIDGDGKAHFDVTLTNAAENISMVNLVYPAEALGDWSIPSSLDAILDSYISDHMSTEQDGTLEGIGKHWDLAIAENVALTVDGDNATFNASLKSLINIFDFTFSTPATETVTKLTIDSWGDYGEYQEETLQISVTPTSSLNHIYVAIPFLEGWGNDLAENVCIQAFVNSATYSRVFTYSNADKEKGKKFNCNGLELDSGVTSEMHQGCWVDLGEAGVWWSINLEASSMSGPGTNLDWQNLSIYETEPVPYPTSTEYKGECPTKEDFEKLMSYTTQTRATINGVEGIKFSNTMDSSKFIFLPTCMTHSQGGYWRGYYWTSTDGLGQSSSYATSFIINPLSNLTYFTILDDNSDKTSGYMVRPIGRLVE